MIIEVYVSCAIKRRSLSADTAVFIFIYHNIMKWGAGTLFIAIFPCSAELRELIFLVRNLCLYHCYGSKDEGKYFRFVCFWCFLTVVMNFNNLVKSRHCE